MAQLDTADLEDLLPTLLVVRLAENPECTPEQSAAAICKVIDRHVERATSGV